MDIDNILINNVEDNKTNKIEDIDNINDINDNIIFDEEINKEEINDKEEELEFDIILENPNDNLN